ncbi:MAG: type II toxin-antitoxin system HicB family antitoxin [Bacteroidales bacterium]|jgi:predicted HicB family RNase H-like nuclease|nr:type II toxin-antitoxin system HicB family antitoxin [Bacteroidales bacterium]
MKDVIKYKDHRGSVRFSADDRLFYGKIEGIDDLVTFEGRSVDELVSAFEEAVEDYISLCDQSNKPVQKSYKGSFNVRINPELHKKAAFLSSAQGLSLNELVEEAIQRYVADLGK